MTGQPASLSVRRIGRLRVESFPTRAAMGAASAAAVAQAMRARLAARPEIRMIFAAAPSQSEMLDALCAADGIDWSRVTAFHMDEYIGLAPDDPARFANWLGRNLFDRVPFKAVHRIVPEPDPAAAAAAYAVALAEAPVDIVCLGIGVNGHIAFNDPPVADFNDPLDAKVVELEHTCRMQQVDDGCFRTLADVPRTALTLTVPRLVRADKLIAVVPGRAKRDAVRQALYRPLSPACPGSILRETDCTLFLDSESDPDA